MGRVLESYEPKDVFKYFEDICEIPHGSGNTKLIADYIENFAKERNLKYVRDDLGNIVIYKDGSKGYEDHPTVIFQGHMDMVCEKESNISKDMEKDGLNVFVEDGFVKAKGTTLGGDDGIAVACGLAILADDSLKHPPLEVVITVDEEIGMVGAQAFDCSLLKGRLMLNADSENEKELLCGCAGGATVTVSKDVKRENTDGALVEINISGLTGGHSGCEIDRQRGNANVLMGRILHDLVSEFDIRLISIDGGTKDNAITRECLGKILVSDKGKADQIINIVKELAVSICNEYKVTDPELNIKTSVSENIVTQAVFDRNTAKDVINMLYTVPAGIQKMSNELPGLVQTSLNLGVSVTSENEIKFTFLVRSSVESEKKDLVSKIKCIADMCGFNMSVSGDYPGWEFKSGSPLQEKYLNACERVTGVRPTICTVHAGVECGFFAKNLDGLDCVSFGPDLRDIHTTRERMGIASVEKMYRVIKELLSDL